VADLAARGAGLAQIEAAFGRDASVTTPQQALEKLKNWDRQSDEEIRAKLSTARRVVIPNPGDPVVCLICLDQGDVARDFTCFDN
jgi:hypothetical protein